LNKIFEGQNILVVKLWANGFLHDRRWDITMGLPKKTRPKKGGEALKSG
jgi:hypothetical protein